MFDEILSITTLYNRVD